MAIDIDSFIPNFTMFMYLTAIAIAAIFLIILAYRWATRRRLTFADMLEYMPAIYMIFVLYEVGEYLVGTRSTIMDRLFEIHFYNMMFLIVCIGIAQVVYYFISERRATV